MAPTNKCLAQRNKSCTGDWLDELIAMATAVSMMPDLKSI
jgi:hypothetical protein